jgi:hypothetical protein
MLLGSVASLLAAILLVSSPVLAMAQPTTTTGTTTTPPPQPLTPQELQEQQRLQDTITATTRNLVLGQKQVDGIVFTPRWSSPAWVEADSLSVLFAYCLPGEFADSGQQILGGSGLEVLESYALAATSDLMLWLMVIENEDENFRYPAAVGVICASDSNDPDARVLSSGEQTVINNIVKQFINIQNVQITNITQVINIINNVTTNGTGTTTPPPMGNNTGGNNTGGGPFQPPTVPGGVGGGVLDNATVAQADTRSPVVTVPSSYIVTTSALGEGSREQWTTQAVDDVDGMAILGPDNVLIQADEPGITGNTVGGPITISCNPPSSSIFPVGVTTVECTASDASGNTGIASFSIRVIRPPVSSPFLAQEQPPVEGQEQEGAPVQEEEAATEEQPAVQEEQAPPTAGGDEGGAASPPANDEGGGEE